MPHYKQDQPTRDNATLVITSKNTVPEDFQLNSWKNINSGIHFSFIVDGVLDAKIAIDVTALESYFDVVQIIEALTSSTSLLRKFNQQVRLIISSDHFNRYAKRNIA